MKNQIKNMPIGVFDSGLGGLTVVKKIIEQLPHEDIVYVGDTARMPYGDKSREKIIEYTRQDMRFLLTKQVKAVCIACNTADSMAKKTLEAEFDLPIIGSVAPAAKKAVDLTGNKRIGVIGTVATIASGTYKMEISQLDPACKVFSQACPLLAPLVEAGRFHKGDSVVETVLRDYLLPLKEKEIDVIILGCTHYPLLYDIVADILPGVEIICSGYTSVDSLKRRLAAMDLLTDRTDAGEHSFFVSDAPERFAENGSVFLGMSVRERCKKVDLEAFQ